MIECNELSTIWLKNFEAINKKKRTKKKPKRKTKRKRKEKKFIEINRALSISIEFIQKKNAHFWSFVSV